MKVLKSYRLLGGYDQLKEASFLGRLDFSIRTKVRLLYLCTPLFNRLVYEVDVFETYKGKRKVG